MILLAIVSDIKTAIPVLFLIGIANVLYTTATSAIIQVEARREMHGRWWQFRAYF